MENSLQNGRQVSFKTVTRDWTSTILQSQSQSEVTMVIVINVVIGAFSGEDVKWLAHVTVWLQVSDYSQLSDYSCAD